MIDIPYLHAEQDRVLSSIPKMNARAGRGIVTTAYDGDFASAWVQLTEMAQLGVDLPIEIWYRTGELSREQLRLLCGLKLDLQFGTIKQEVSGWATKMFAILNSQFSEVLWIDTDNVPIRDPKFLFDDPDYRQTGMLLWRDVSGIDRADRWHRGSPLWNVFRVPYCEIEEIDAGQFVIDLERHWETFILALHYNANPKPYYDILHGDKDTLKLAALFLGAPFSLMPFGPFHIGAPNPWGKWGGGSVMQQRDRCGKPLFNHRTIDKFTLKVGDDGKPRELDERWALYGPEQEPSYLAHLARLRSLTSLRVIEIPPIL